MNTRITLSRQTVKVMRQRLQHAYDRGDTRLVRRISALLEVLDAKQDVSAVSDKWAWKCQQWPTILKSATARHAMILFGDEASFPKPASPNGAA